MIKRDLFIRKVVRGSCSHHLHLILRRCIVRMNHACLIIISVINLLQEFGLHPTKYHNSLFPSTYLDMKHTPLPPAGTPGLFDLNDEKLLNRAFEKARFKNIQIEKVKVTFKFDTAEDYTKFTQNITTLLMVW